MSTAADAVLIEIRPQLGPQEQFLSSRADIAFFGGARGGGKTFALLMEGTRHVGNPGFGGVIFRRTFPQIRNEGGLWDDSEQLYPHLGAWSKESTLEWVFPSRAKLRFAHLEHEADLQNWLGAQFAFLGIDQAEQFTEREFFFLLSSLRSTSGVRPYSRLTCNPDPDCWLATFLEYWIGEDGYPIEARSGKLRWMLRVGDGIHWFGSKAEARAALPKFDLPAEVEPQSVTFIPARVEDNKILMQKDPSYLAKLYALPLVERERFKGGNWKIRPTAGNVFNRAWFVKFVDAVPVDGIVGKVRYWDKAGSENRGKYSAGVKIYKAKDGRFFIVDVVRGRWGSLERENVIKATATLDGRDVDVWEEQEPGSGGKESAEATIRNLAGFHVRAHRPTGSKYTRARPFSAQCQAGNVILVRGAWNKDFIDEHHNFDEKRADSGVLICDQVDAASGGFNKLAEQRKWGMV